MSAKTALRWLAFSLPLLSITYLIRFQLVVLPTTLLEIILGIFVLGVLLTTKREGLARAHFALKNWRWPIIAWVLTTLLAVVIAPSVWSGLGLWRAYVLEPILVLITLCALLDQPGDKKKLEQGMMIAGIAVSVWAIVGYLGNWGIPHPWNVAISAGRRAVGPFGFPNGVSLFVAPIGALAIARIAQLVREKSFKLLSLSTFTALSTFVGLLLAQSQGGLLAFGVVMLIALLMFRRGRWLVLAGVVLVGVASLLLPTLRDLFIHQATFKGWSGKVRLIMWSETWAMLKDHWFFGAGFGGYPKVFDAYHTARYIEIFQYPHNILLNFWSETGLLGVFAFLGLIVTWIRETVVRVSRSPERASTPVILSEAAAQSKDRPLPSSSSASQKLTLLAPLIAILVQGLVDVPYFKNDLALFFWMFIWLVIVHSSSSTSPSNKSEAIPTAC